VTVVQDPERRIEADDPGDVDDFATLALGSGNKERGIRLWAAARRVQDTIGIGLVRSQMTASGQSAWREPQPGDATPERHSELEAEGRSMTSRRRWRMPSTTSCRA
jgi:uncharacterized protein YPO0396